MSYTAICQYSGNDLAMNDHRLTQYGNDHTRQNHQRDACGHLHNAVPEKVSPSGSLQARRDKHGAVTLLALQHWHKVRACDHRHLRFRSTSQKLGTHHQGLQRGICCAYSRGTGYGAPATQSNWFSPALVAAQKASKQAQAAKVVQSRQVHTGKLADRLHSAPANTGAHIIQRRAGHLRQPCNQGMAKHRHPTRL